MVMCNATCTAQPQAYDSSSLLQSLCSLVTATTICGFDLRRRASHHASSKGPTRVRSPAAKISADAQMPQIPSSAGTAISRTPSTGARTSGTRQAGARARAAATCCSSATSTAAAWTTWTATASAPAPRRPCHLWLVLLLALLYSDCGDCVESALPTSTMHCMSHAFTKRYSCGKACACVDDLTCAMAGNSTCTVCDDSYFIANNGTCARSALRLATAGRALPELLDR